MNLTSPLSERKFQSEFCVVIAGGGGQGDAKITLIVSRYVKAKFCVVI